jgi:drug/metabolite transporter (DMT)-like permease
MSETAPLAARRGAAAFAALVVGALAMGLSPIFVRLADVGPFTSAFWRVALALPALYAWMRLAFAGDLLFWHSGILRTSVANATFFATTAPIWVVAFGWMLFGRRAERRTLAGLALCLCGGAALLAQSLRLRPEGAIGDAFGLATGVFFGLYFLAVEAALRSANAARVTFEATLITAGILLLVAVGLERAFLPASFAGLAALLGLAWISHAGGQGLLSVALGRLPATFSSLVIFLEAVAAAVFAALLLGEPISALQAVGGVLIMGGIFIARPRGP